MPVKNKPSPDKQAKRSRAMLMCLAVFLLANPLAGETGETAISGTGLDKCRTEPDRIDRLSCFDALFGTPAFKPDLTRDAVKKTEPGTNDSNENRYASIIRDAEPSNIFENPEIKFVLQFWDTENYLTRDEYALISGLADPVPGSPFEEMQQKIRARTFNVFIGLPEILPADADEYTNPATLLLACENNITFLALLPSENFPGTQGKMKINSDKSELKSGDWSKLDDKLLLLSPRGLEAVRLTSTIFQTSRIQLTMRLKNETKDYIFNTTGLEAAAKPVRKGCHW